MSPDRQDVTRLLQQWKGGSHEALDQLMPVVYDELRRLAGRCLQSERPGHTLRATALVHEAYLRLMDADIGWQDRAHFYAVAARVVRRILVEYAGRAAAKSVALGNQWSPWTKRLWSDRRRHLRFWIWTRPCNAWQRWTRARARLSNSYSSAA